MPSEADKLKARQRLALRAERAFGLSAIRFSQRSQDAVAPQDEMHEPPPQVHPADGPSQRDVGIPATPTSGTNLFGQAVDALRTPPPVVSSHAALTPEILSTDEKRLRLRQLDENEVRGCTKCRLCEKRTNTVFGEGDPDSKIFFIGEGPGENEDLQGRPFIGRAGELLNKWIAAMGLRREQVFIANIVKCRPPGNREPAPDETATCTPYLQRQLEIIRPHVIITLGRPSAQYMLQSKLSMGKLRGQWHAWRGIKLMPTFHPAYVLRSYNDQTRAAVWSDLKNVMAELGLPVPPSSKRSQ